MPNPTELVLREKGTGCIICTLCFKSSEGGQPFARCSRCLRARYCSKTCQKTDWPNHKDRCNEAHRALEVAKEIRVRLLEGDPTGKLPRELDPVQIMEDLRKWNAKQRPVIAMALLHALDLHMSMDRVYKEGVCFFIERRQTEEKKTTANRFVIKKILRLPINEITSEFSHQCIVDHAAYVHTVNSDVTRKSFLPFALVIHEGIAMALHLSIEHGRRKTMVYDPNWLRTLKIEEETGEHEIRYA